MSIDNFATNFFETQEMMIFQPKPALPVKPPTKATTVFEPILGGIKPLIQPTGGSIILNPDLIGMTPQIQPIGGSVFSPYLMDMTPLIQPKPIPVIPKPISPVKTPIKGTLTLISDFEPQEPPVKPSVGGSLIVEPLLGLPVKPITGSPVIGGSPMGGGSGVITDETLAETGGVDVLQNKKKFPFVLVGVALVVGYLIFKKK